MSDFALGVLIGLLCGGWAGFGLMIAYIRSGRV